MGSCQEQRKSRMTANGREMISVPAESCSAISVFVNV